MVENERDARQLAQRRGQRLRTEQLAQRSKGGVSLESLFSQLQEGAIQDLNLILKGDVGGSVEAAVSELAKIEHPEVRVNVIHQGVGPITEGDIMLAATSNALVVGFNVRPNAEARALAEREGVDIRTYRVIYQLTDDIEQALVGMLSAVQTEEIVGEAEVRALFKVSRLGTIAGCMVTQGVVRRSSQVRVVRDGTVIYDTTISQLKRFKEDAREVAEGFECGILLDGFNDVKEGDVLEAYETRQVERTSLDEPAGRTGCATRRSSALRLGRDPLRRAALSRSALSEGEAHVRALGEGAAEEPLRRGGRRGRPPRRLAARPAHGRGRHAQTQARRSACSRTPSGTSPRASGSSAGSSATSSRSTSRRDYSVGACPSGCAESTSPSARCSRRPCSS